MSEKITYENFTGQLNTKFKITLGEALEGLEGADLCPTETEVELVEAVKKETDATEGFSLLFQGPQNVFLNQQTHKFNHDKIGDFELFIVPVGKNDSGYQYEAIINRLKENK